MILTCPACDTRYVIKDGAIPPGGRKVRCAACKHSWHQDPEAIETMAVEMVDEQLPNPLSDISGPPEPDPYAVTPPSEPGPHEIADQFVAEAPEPDPMEIEGERAATAALVDRDYPATDWHEEQTGGHDSGFAHDEAGHPDRHAPVEDGSVLPESDDQDAAAADEVYYVEQLGAPGSRYPESERRSSKWLWLIGLLALIAAAAAAFWFFAPAEWKNRAGIARAGESPLQLVITSKPDRQILSSGNELVSVSGKVTNPTNSDQNVPPIQATLRNHNTKKIIHRWTIAPPAKVLAPGSSASFNSAEVDIPSGGDELTIAWTN